MNSHYITDDGCKKLNGFSPPGDTAIVCFLVLWLLLSTFFTITFINGRYHCIITTKSVNHMFWLIKPNWVQKGTFRGPMVKNEIDPTCLTPWHVWHQKTLYWNDYVHFCEQKHYKKMYKHKSEHNHPESKFLVQYMPWD